MKLKFLKAVSMLQAFIMIVGICAFTMPLKADAASLGITPSTQFQNGVYYQRACNAYSSYSDPRTRMVQIALSQAGYKGGTNSGDWSGSGAGGRYTEYGRFMGTDGKDWCAAFVSWCAAAAGIPTTVIPRSSGAGYWRNAGTGTYTPLWSNGYTTYNPYKPQVGDFALYMPYCTTCGGHYNAASPTAHVVIVASVSDTQNANGSWTFTTIERGNSNTVQSKTVTTKDTRGSKGTCTCNDKQVPEEAYAYVVQGFWRPDWSLLGTTVLKSGSFDAIRWKYDSDCNLIIEGSGEITQCPWLSSTNIDSSYAIKNIVIGDGITGITCLTGAFSGTYNGNSGIIHLESVSIASSTKIIGDKTFYGLSNLKTVNLGGDIETIGKNAFSGCMQLENFQIPRSVTTIGESAFSSCQALKSVTLSSNLTSIGKRVFQYCRNLESVNIENGVSEISDYMFSDCDSLTSIYIPVSVAKIGDRAFLDCNLLSEIVVDENNMYYHSKDGILFNNDGDNLVTYPKGKEGSSYQIPENVLKINSYAFRSNPYLTSVSIPMNVTDIGAFAFYGCDNLTDIYLSVSEEDWANNTVIGNKAIPDTATLHYLENVAEGEFGNITWALDSTGKLTILGSGEMTQAPWSSYSDKIKMVIVGGTITNIADFAFEGCSQLAECYITPGVTRIGNGAFYGCSALKAITIPEFVTTVGDWAFRNCTSLSNVYFDVTKKECESNVTVGSNAFPAEATLHYATEGLDFRILDNANGLVTFGWNYDGAEEYLVSIYDETGNQADSYTAYAQDAVNGKFEVTLALAEGNYVAYIAMIYSSVMTSGPEVEFTVEIDESLSYEVKNLSGNVSNGRFYADVEVVSKIARDTDDTIVIAVYKNDEMIDFVYMKTDIPDDKIVHFGGMLEGSEGAVLKAFVWDSIEGMKCLSNVIEE